MLIDRRTLLASGVVTLMPRLAQAQAQVICPHRVDRLVC
jgi:hypothetical protein